MPLDLVGNTVNRKDLPLGDRPRENVAINDMQSHVAARAEAALFQDFDSVRPPIVSPKMGLVIVAIALSLLAWITL